MDGARQSPCTACRLRVRAAAQILEEKHQLSFHLQQQRLIELVREGRTEEALEFAQEYLAPRGEEHPAFLGELGAQCAHAWCATHACGVCLYPLGSTPPSWASWVRSARMHGELRMHAACACIPRGAPRLPGRAGCAVRACMVCYAWSVPHACGACLTSLRSTANHSPKI